MLNEAKRTEALGILKETYPDAKPALHFSSPFELLVATMLSAQCTDKQVNKCTDVLFPLYNTAEQFAALDFETLEPYIKSCGFYRMKGMHILEMSRILVEKYGGRVPETREELTELPGVGRKTANLVCGDIYGKPAVVTDTHFIRICNRLGFVETTNPLKVEKEMRKLLPEEKSNDFCHRTVLFGRDICTARKAKCEECPLNEFCPKKL